MLNVTSSATREGYLLYCKTFLNSVSRLHHVDLINVGNAANQMRVGLCNCRWKAATAHGELWSLPLRVRYDLNFSRHLEPFSHMKPFKLFHLPIEHGQSHGNQTLGGFLEVGPGVDKNASLFVTGNWSFTLSQSSRSDPTPCCRKESIVMWGKWQLNFQKNEMVTGQEVGVILKILHPVTPLHCLIDCFSSVIGRGTENWSCELLLFIERQVPKRGQDYLHIYRAYPLGYTSYHITI